MPKRLRFDELTSSQQYQARARFIDAGTDRDNYWYELDIDGRVLCRTREMPR